MAEITIYGASDDLVEVEGAIVDEFEAYGQWRGRLQAPNGQTLYLYAEYGAAGADTEWLLGITNSATYPSWPIRFSERQDRAGDPAIIIDVPDGTKLTEVK